MRGGDQDEGVLPFGQMSYYQDIVVDYLRENRAIFVNTECCIQLNEGSGNQIGPYWYCDALAVDFGQNAVYLCEVTYARGTAALLKTSRAVERPLARDKKQPRSR
jgi:hypothetical protein